MIVIICIGIILAVIIIAFGIELIIAALYPGVSVPRQHLEKIPGFPREKNINWIETRKDVNFDVNDVPP